MFSPPVPPSQESGPFETAGADDVLRQAFLSTPPRSRRPRPLRVARGADVAGLVVAQARGHRRRLRPRRQLPRDARSIPESPSLGVSVELKRFAQPDRPLPQGPRRRGSTLDCRSPASRSASGLRPRGRLQRTAPAYRYPACSSRTSTPGDVRRARRRGGARHSAGPRLPTVALRRDVDVLRVPRARRARRVEGGRVGPGRRRAASPSRCANRSTSSTTMPPTPAWSPAPAAWAPSQSTPRSSSRASPPPGKKACLLSADRSVGAPRRRGHEAWEDVKEIRGDFVLDRWRAYLVSVSGPSDRRTSSRTRSTSRTNMPS